jgi:hypothetical protein
MALKDALETLGKKLEKMMTDFSELTVTTSTVDPSGKVTPRAKTVVHLDGDTDIHVPTTDGSAIATDLLVIHNDAVQSAIEARVKTISAVVDAARAILPG